MSGERSGQHHLFQASTDFADALMEQLLAGADRPLALTMPDLSGTRFDEVCETFRLTPFERWVLFIAAATHLLPASMLRACAAEFGLYETSDALNTFLCPYVFQQWFGQPDLTAFAPTSALRTMNLIQMQPTSLGHGNELLFQIRVTPGALAFIEGSRELSGEAAAFLLPLGQGAWLGESQQAALEELTQVLSDPAPRSPIVNLYSLTPGAALEVVQMHGQGAGDAPCWLLDFGQIERSVQQEHSGPEAILGQLHRDLCYLGGTLVIRLEQEPDAAPAASRLAALGWSPRALTEALCSRLPGDLIVITRDPLVLDPGRDLYAIPVERPTPEEQATFWGQALGFSRLSLSRPEVQGELEHLTGQFSLGSQKIQQVARDALRRAHQRYGAKPSRPQLMGEVWEACKRQGRTAFQGIADQIPAHADWSSLILPPDDLVTLRDIVTQVQHRHEVYRAWGYGASERGLGITVLFSGVSGGGKTFAAEVLANALNLDLYRIDLSSVTSKWIGETEKNLKKVFDAADEGGAILLFDEADSVFGKRGDVQGSNDRYANLTTNYLLQRMEAYRGLAILTTNYEGNIDPAFMRRIRFTVRFREPDESLRAQLWQRAFPAGVEVAGLDYRVLARSRLTGANVKAIAMNASFLARARQVPITTELVEEAISRELRRQGRLILGAASS